MAHVFAASVPWTSQTSDPARPMISCVCCSTHGQVVRLRSPRARHSAGREQLCYPICAVTLLTRDSVVQLLHFISLELHPHQGKTILANRPSQNKQSAERRHRAIGIFHASCSTEATAMPWPDPERAFLALVVTPSIFPSHGQIALQPANSLAGSIAALAPEPGSYTCMDTRERLHPCIRICISLRHA